MTQEGIRLHFKIDEDYFLVHLLTCSSGDDNYSSTEYQKDIVMFLNEAWKKDRNVYNLLAGISQSVFTIGNGKLVEATIRAADYLSEVKQLSQFRKLISQTQSYVRFCEDQWKKNYLVASSFIRDITGFNLNKDMDVYVTHPNLRNGDCLVKYGIIEWGHHEDSQNYATVYLWHEILHSYLDMNYVTIGYHDGISSFVEGVVESITDEMLRCKLNGEPYEPFVGREELIPFKRKLLPMLEARTKGGASLFSDFMETAKQIFIKEFKK